MESAADLRRHVLVVAPQPFYEDRGTPIAVRHVLEALSQLGYEVDLLTFPIGRSLAIRGVRYCRVKHPLAIRSVPIGFSLRKLWLDVFLFFSLTRMLRRRQYFCIHAVEEAAFLALVAARGRIPVIYDMQSSVTDQLAEHPLLGRWPARGLLKVCERWMISHADAVVCSAGLAKHVQSVAQSNRVREWFFPGTAPDPALDARQLRAQLDIGPRQKIVLYAGNFADYQGLPLLVEAIPTVLSRIPQAVFVLVGSQSPDDMMLANRLAAVAADKALRILPRQPRHSMPRFSQMADVVVSPRSRGSNLPLKAFDYLAAGCALVATSIPAHLSVLSNEFCVLVEPTSSALADAITDLLKNPERMQELRSAARQYAESSLNWANFVRFVSDLYEELAADG